MNTFPLFLKRSCIISIQLVSNLFYLSFQKRSSFFMHVSSVVKLSFQNLVQTVELCFLAFIVGVDLIISGIIPSYTKIKNDRKNIGCSAVMQVQALKGFDKIISISQMTDSIFLPKILHSGISSNSKMAFFFFFFQFSGFFSFFFWVNDGREAQKHRA